MIPMSYVFILNDINKENVLYDNIMRIMDHEPKWIGVFHSFSEINDKILNFLSKLEIKHNVVLSYSKIDDLSIVDKFIKNYPNSWNLMNVVGEELLLDAREKITFLTNNHSALLIKNSSINGMAFQTYVYKTLNGNLINEEDIGLEIYSYESKLIKKYNGQKFIKTWEEVDEICNSHT